MGRKVRAMAQGQVVNISEASSGDPYRLRKPVFEFADKRARDYNVDTRSAPEILRSIEQQNAEILQNLGTLNEGAAEEVASSSIKSLWRLFWACQIVGFASLI